MKKWKPVILSTAFLLGIILMMLTIIHHYKIYNILHNEKGYYVEKHIFFDKIYIGSNQENIMDFKITSIKETKNNIIIETNSGELKCKIGLCDLHRQEYKKISKYLHILSHKKVIVLDNYGNEMHEYK